MPSNTNCDFCGTALGEALYHPIGSLRNMAVFGCERCGLLQSLSLAPFEDFRRVSLSCDADWGNVRHGKAARLPHLLPLLGDLPWGEIHTVLDVGANRGSFVTWLAEHHPGRRIYAVEPDPMMTSEYAGHFGITTVHGRLDEGAVPICDFLYNVQTLEHADSAVSMLRTCHAALRPDGLMLLEVPNVAALAYRHNVEEFFIDKHTFHFDAGVLLRMLAACGFEVVRSMTDYFNITLLLRKTDENEPTDAPAPRDQREMLQRYAETLEENRRRLHLLYKTKLWPLAQRQQVGYWGAGRIFSALCRYGGLPTGEVHVLVDSYLWRWVAETEGVLIEQPDALKATPPCVLVVLARSSSEALREEARRYGIRWVVTFEELMEQV